MNVVGSHQSGRREFAGTPRVLPENNPDYLRKEISFMIALAMMLPSIDGLNNQPWVLPFLIHEKSWEELPCFAVQK
ncbi:MAG: hypothetical protein ACOC4R_00650 [Bacteroidota bacterium]